MLANVQECWLLSKHERL